jgi:hypothetical protein
VLICSVAVIVNRVAIGYDGILNTRIQNAEFCKYFPKMTGACKTIFLSLHGYII